MNIMFAQTGGLDKPGIWKYSYLLLVANKKIKVKDSKKNEIISELEQRLKWP
jgi:hypothetical protein